MYLCVCVWGCLDKYISVATWPPKQKFLAPPLDVDSSFLDPDSSFLVYLWLFAFYKENYKIKLQKSFKKIDWEE